MKRALEIITTLIFLQIKKYYYYKDTIIITTNRIKLNNYIFDQYMHMLKE